MVFFFSWSNKYMTSLRKTRSPADIQTDVKIIFLLSFNVSGTSPVLSIEKENRRPMNYRVKVEKTHNLPYSSSNRPFILLKALLIFENRAAEGKVNRSFFITNQMAYISNLPSAISIQLIENLWHRTETIPGSVLENSGFPSALLAHFGVGNNRLMETS